MRSSDKNPKYIVLGAFMCLLLSNLPISFAQARTNEAAKSDKAKPSSLNDFTYTSQRRDPFERALAFRAKNQLGAEALKVGYELEELKLVGVMKAGSEKFAVMEDMQGKGLLFKKGQNLNSNLWVSDILEEKIILAHRLRRDVRMITLNIPRK
ncbi:MAG TPA: hypothetical protein DCR97_11335 [Deltaproteobacteria bacterium]|nr:hypothetical protein [Deltaproteobacteria bacterium]